MKYDFMAPKVRDAMVKDNSDFELLVPTGFEWDDAKSDANLAKHGITFDDASEVFADLSLSGNQPATTRRDGSRSEYLMID